MLLSRANDSTNLLPTIKSRFNFTHALPIPEDILPNESELCPTLTEDGRMGCDLLCRNWVIKSIPRAHHCQAREIGTDLDRKIGSSIPVNRRGGSFVLFSKTGRHPPLWGLGHERIKGLKTILFECALPWLAKG